MGLRFAFVTLQRPVWRWMVASSHLTVMGVLFDTPFMTMVGGGVCLSTLYVASVEVVTLGFGALGAALAVGTTKPKAAIKVTSSTPSRFMCL